ncbi:hypothetical protein BAUCODRAFT_452817 [Baudoinia panamericana UAMH 10762]|uniref:NAD(P)-binding domain-containing protein n=1 Tax=Baudoinia panamericana (strain UAMH 10762) TaxID=717646 RepID=M2NER7_BAUPA|nr:uncharacterized protein BAUCODRAFT_452817 [Baudoinia panamericana UAMH 10762]EMC97455.1 hypothetical protein BAUCODRAFT_452817 [Baudoinia panamericana UAMH 10762]
MVPRVFITGVTGYIAGDALSVINAKHPDYDYSILVRTQDKADIVKKAYPNVRTVLGDLDNSELLRQQASRADIVLHAADASDHEGAARAIAAGMIEGHSKERPGFWLHTGGTGILTYKDDQDGKLGVYSEKQYNDWTGIDELVSLPDNAFHRNVDKVVLETGTKHGDVVKTAIICPPTIYGRGRGPVSVRSRQAYELAKLILTTKYVPVVGEGKARWNNVHVHDLSQLFLLLTEAAAAHRPDKELWGAQGYYFTENGEHYWTELATHIASEAGKLGFVGELKQRALSKDEAMQQAGFEAVSWGWNSRGKAERAKRLLKWQPSGPSIEDEAVNIIKDEHSRLQKRQ